MFEMNNNWNVNHIVEVMYIQMKKERMRAVLKSDKADTHHAQPMNQNFMQIFAANWT